MNTSERCCSFCLDPGHNIRTCSDIRIENGWREILRRSNIHRGSLLNDEDLVGVRTYLQTFPEILLTAVAVQHAQSRVLDLVETKVHNICLWIYREALRFENLSFVHQYEFLHWIDPETYPSNENDTDSDDDIPSLISADESDFIPIAPEESHHLIEPLMLCFESAEELGEQSECPICFDEELRILDMNTTSCEHSFCHSCIIRHLKRINNCPMCRSQVKTLQVRQTEHYDKVMAEFGPITRNRCITQDDINEFTDILTHIFEQPPQRPSFRPR